MVSIVADKSKMPSACYKLHSEFSGDNKPLAKRGFCARYFNKTVNPVKKQFIEKNTKKMDKYILKQVEDICNHTSNLFHQNGFNNIDPNKFLIEIHRYDVDCIKKDELIKSEFDWHKDDCGAVSYDVCSAIYYLRKDYGIIGGDIEFKDFGVVKIVPPMILLFNGDLIHRPMPMKGHGCRNSIVVMFKRVKT